jgi:integrase/recombinase XerC
VRVLGKGRKTRIVPVGRKAASASALWLKERGALAASTKPRCSSGRTAPAEAPRHPAAHRVLGARKGLPSRVLSAPVPSFLRHASA